MTRNKYKRGKHNNVAKELLNSSQQYVWEKIAENLELGFTKIPHNKRG